MVNVHLLNAQVERVASTQRHRSDGIVATKWAAQDIANSGALAGFEVELHLVEAAAQLHLVRNVVVNVEHLRFSVAAVGHEELYVEIVAFVQVVS